MFENTNDATLEHFHNSAQRSQAESFQTTGLMGEKIGKTVRGKPVWLTTPQMLLFSDTTGLHSNPAGQ